MGKIDYVRLLGHEPSSFAHGMWDAIDWQGLLDYSDVLERQEQSDTQHFGRSLVADAFYALRGCQPDTSDPLGAAWAEAMREGSFHDLQRQFERGGRGDQALTTMALGAAVIRSLEAKNEPPRDGHVGGPYGKSAYFANGQPQPISPADQVFRDVYKNQLGPPIMERYDSISEQIAKTGGMSPSYAPLQIPPAPQPPAQHGAAPDDAAEEELEIDPTQIEQSAKDAKGVSTFVSAVGGFLKGGPPQVFAEALKLRGLVNLKDFAQILGFTKKVVSGAAREQRGGTDELTSYRPGAISDRTLSTELRAITQHRRDALGRLADNALIRREYHANTPQGKGPVILCRDESGSMGGVNADRRHKRALAFEIGMAGVFNEEGRDLISIRWGSDATPPFVYGDGDVSRHLQSFLNHSSTEPVAAVRLAVETAANYVEGADILVLTDGAFTQGQAEQLPAILKPFRDRGGRAWMVSVGEKSGATAIKWADAYVHVDELGTNDQMAEILRRITQREMPDRVQIA